MTICREWVAPTVPPLALNAAGLPELTATVERPTAPRVGMPVEDLRAALAAWQEPGIADGAILPGQTAYDRLSDVV
jgi:hypothetical protein